MVSQLAPAKVEGRFSVSDLKPKKNISDSVCASGHQGKSPESINDTNVYSDALIR